ncbi:DNA-binding protein, partial [Staphylococcus pasteuri]
MNIEAEMIKHKYTNGVIQNDVFIGENLLLPKEIEENYISLCNLLLETQNLPSLMYYDEKIIKYAKKYCLSVEKALNNLSDNEKIIDQSLINLHKLGVIEQGNRVYFTSLHPLLMRYEIEKTMYFNETSVNEKVFKKYNAVSLLPYFVDSNSNFYFSNYSESNARWISYEPFENTNKMNPDKIIFIIKTRLHDFYMHFNYLFNINYNFSIKVRFVDISNHKVILQGVLEFLLEEMKNIKSIHQINPINLYFDYSSNLDELYEFYNISDYNSLLEIYNIRIPNPIKKKFEEDDVIDILKEKINLFIDKEITLYHITFYNFNKKPTFSVSNLDEIDSSVTQNGLLSNISYTKLGNTFLSGFGTYGIKNKSNLIESAVLWNSFISSNQNHQLNPYKKGQGIVNNIISLENQHLDNIFNNTNWVTFLDPSVDLSYFNNDDYELYVIHYNDQTSSFNYESITVTNDTQQYSMVLKEFLNKVNVNYNPENIENIIRSFNILNGEWLLNVIGNRSTKSSVTDNSVREKLSIISAYKQVLAILDNSKIKWIPISLEEILRVSRNQGLEHTSDIFSAKELKHEGSISDDLLFIGVELTEDNPKVHLMPVEVKVGINNS